MDLLNELLVLEIPVATDGFCGLEHGNATFVGTDKQCCNSGTWMCGNSAYVSSTFFLAKLAVLTEMPASTVLLASVTKVLVWAET